MAEISAEQQKLLDIGVTRSENDVKRIEEITDIKDVLYNRIDKQKEHIENIITELEDTLKHEEV